MVWLAHEANMSGANIAMMEYALVLKDEYDFHFILPHAGNMRNALENMGFATTIIHQYGWAVPVPGKRTGISWRVKLRSLKAIRDTCRVCKKEKATMVFTNTQIPFTAAVAANKLNLPHVWWLHEFGEEDFGFTIGFGKRDIGDRLMEKSRLIICNSEAIKRKFAFRMPGVHIERIYQPVSFKKRAELKSTTDIIKYLMFGQIVASKGHKEVLEALAAAIKIAPLRKMALHIKGPSEDESYVDSLRSLIKALDLQDKVIIDTGFFEKETVLPLYDVLIMASKAEAFGRAIIEAGKAGLKVIVKNNGGAPELMNTTNGLLYNSPMELTAILAGEIAMPPGPVVFNYSEETEMSNLKNYLAIL